jgi:hypothetical protein
MKKALLLLVALAISSTAFASPTKAIEDTFHRYWSAFVRKDFARAATDVLPTDLTDTRAALLPVFLGAQSHKDKEVQEIVTAFFGRTVGRARESITAPEAFAGLQRVMALDDDDTFELLRQATTTIVFVRTIDADNVEIHFQITFRGESDMEIESLTRKDGRWWVRVRENPKDVAAQFQAMFTKGS